VTQPQVYVRGFIRFVLYETDLEMPEFSVHPNTTPTEYIILPWTGPPHKTDCFAMVVHFNGIHGDIISLPGASILRLFGPLG
jgi:hypothetical protein